jgi:hypothetical protein
MGTDVSFAPDRAAHNHDATRPLQQARAFAKQVGQVGQRPDGHNGQGVAVLADQLLVQGNEFAGIERLGCVRTSSSC